MKVNGPSAASPTERRAAGRPAADGFSPSGAGGAAGAAPAVRAATLGAVDSLQTLLALQETPSPLERRRRAVRRGTRILDALDELRLAALDPQALDGPALRQLQAAVREARADVDDGALDGLLEQIEIRAAVELAKREAGVLA